MSAPLPRDKDDNARSSAAFGATIDSQANSGKGGRPRRKAKRKRRRAESDDAEPDTPPQAPRRQHRCGACNELGHHRTNPRCPKFGGKKQGGAPDTTDSSSDGDATHDAADEVGNDAILHPELSSAEASIEGVMARRAVESAIGASSSASVASLPAWLLQLRHDSLFMLDEMSFRERELAAREANVAAREARVAHMEDALAAQALQDDMNKK